MPCRKCNDTRTHHGLPCVHCIVNKETSDLRRSLYGATKWRVASAALFGLGSAEPYAKLVLSKANELKSLSPPKRAVLAQDIRRCLRSLFTLGGTPQARVLWGLHTIAFKATESTTGGTSWKPDHSGGAVYLDSVRSCGANERWTYDEVIEGRKADHRAAIQMTEDASAGRPAAVNPLKQSLLLSVFPQGGVGVMVAVDVVIDDQMLDGTEFRLADECYHLPPGVSSLVSPMRVGGHGPCVHCDAITASTRLQQFREAFDRARVKAEESNTYRMIRELKELHQKLTGDLAI